MSSSNQTSKILAAAVAATSCGWILRAMYERKRKVDAKYKIPSALLAGDYIKEMELAVKLAIKAGGNMIQHLEQKGTDTENSESSLGISSKSNDADFCTKIDILNEDLVTKALTSTFPSHKIIGEESTGTDKPVSLTNDPTWIIDPIDGTTNFASGCPLTCVSIGFCNNGEPVMGVVFSPKTQELYLAMKGKGAFRNGKRISSKSCKDKTLSNSVVCFEFGSSRAEEGVNKMIGGARRLLMHGIRSTRSYGSGVLDLCYVASSRLDVVYTGMYEEGWKPWDYCAGMVIAEEAGCIIQALKDYDDNGPFDIYSDSMICGVNDAVVKQCREVVLGTSLGEKKYDEGQPQSYQEWIKAAQTGRNSNWKFNVSFDKAADTPEAPAFPQNTLFHKNAETYAMDQTSVASENVQVAAQITTEEDLFAPCMVGTLESQFLKMYTQTTRAGRILDIGTFTGMSAIAFSEGALSSGNSNAHVDTLEFDATTAKAAQKIFDHCDENVGKAISLHQGDAVAWMQALADQPNGETYDIIFIDADKENYIQYYDLAMGGKNGRRSLLSDNGVILADNSLSALLYDQGDDRRVALHEFNQYVKNDDRVEQVVLTMREGITMISRK